MPEERRRPCQSRGGGAHGGLRPAAPGWRPVRAPGREQLRRRGSVPKQRQPI